MSRIKHHEITRDADSMTRISLQRAFLTVVAVATVAGLVPTGVIVYRRLASELEQRARTDLAVAPLVFADRERMSADGLTMHARDIARSPSLGRALRAGDRSAAVAAMLALHDPADGNPILVGPNGTTWIGSDSPNLRRLADGTRSGNDSVNTIVISNDGAWIEKVALAPVVDGSRWLGAVGFAQLQDKRAAGELAGLTRADVILVALPRGSHQANATDVQAAAGATTLDSVTTPALLAALPAELAWSDTASRPRVHDVRLGEARYLVAASPVGEAGFVLFVRSLDSELAVLPALRRLAAASSLAALLVACAVGALLASRLARPVHQLADVADSIAAGEFAAPLPTSGIAEVAALSAAVGDMRDALSVRLRELDATNATLELRNTQLTALQDDLVTRERLAAAGRMAAELAHEIRNPIASLRNCLELVRRRLKHDAEAVEFMDLAIDELLRMHEMAEQMLDVNRSRHFESARCSPWSVACDVATLMTVGASNSVTAVKCSKLGAGVEHVDAAIGAGPLRQVLFNLVQNSREAGTLHSLTTGSSQAPIIIGVGADDLHVVITVTDNGPGIADGVLARIFEPFFTTKADTQGVGLGLFVAEGIVRTASGKLTAANLYADSGVARGAVFTVELPRATSTPLHAARLAEGSS